MEIGGFHRVVTIVESSQPYQARALTRETAESAGFEETDSYRAGLLATELATNLVKHAAGGGEMLIRRVHGPVPEIELIAIDRGPGMRDVARCLADGHSTSGSPGTGLGAVKRLSDEFDIHSEAGRGTAVFARVRAGRRTPVSAPRSHSVGVISVPFTGEDVCGDAWHVRSHDGGVAAIVVDGLGHGFDAAQAANAAVRIFDSLPLGVPSEALRAVHAGIAHTRGAAGLVADLQLTAAQVTVSGVGNVAAVIVGPAAARMAVSQSGTLGHQARLFRDFSYPWPPSDGLLVLHSDGVGTHWSLDDYRGLRRRHPALVATILYRDFSRRRDDATVLVVRIGS